MPKHEFLVEEAGASSSSFTNAHRSSISPTFFMSIWLLLNDTERPLCSRGVDTLVFLDQHVREKSLYKFVTIVSSVSGRIQYLMSTSSVGATEISLGEVGDFRSSSDI